MQMIEGLGSYIVAAALLIGAGILAYLALAVRRIARLHSVSVNSAATNAINSDLEESLPVADEFPPDIVIAPFDAPIVEGGENLPSEIGNAIAPILKSIPSLANLSTGSGNLYRITFSPEVAKGLTDNTYSLMRSGGTFRATAVDRSGKIIGQGKISPDRAASSIAAASAAWQILAIVTAQKFLSDINERLASIEESVKRMEGWLDTQEQGRFLGSMKYLADISRGTSFSAEESLIMRNQVERIYHESLQSIEANILRANAAADALASREFSGSIEDKAAEFRKAMDAYFIPASYAIRFTLVAAYSEYMGAFIDRKPGRELRRIDSIIQDAERMLAKIREDAERMKKKAGQLSGRFWESDESIKTKKKSLRAEMQNLVTSCEDSIERVRMVHEATKRIGVFIHGVEEKGLSVIAKADSSGKITRIQSDTKKR